MRQLLGLGDRRDFRAHGRGGIEGGWGAEWRRRWSRAAGRSRRVLCAAGGDGGGESQRGLASRLVYVVEEAFASATIDSGHLPAQDIDTGFAIEIDANEAI